MDPAFDFFESITEMLSKSVIPVSSEENVVSFEYPSDLQKILSPSLEDCIEPSNNEEIKVFIEKLIKYSVKTGHQNFYNQLFGGLDYYGLAASWISEALNTSQYTYEVAPTFSIIENVVIEESAKIFGFDESKADGLFTPGGSISNMYAISMARYKVCPRIKTDGITNCQRFVIFTSENAHYSITKSSHWLGIGSKNIIFVKSDDCGRMVPKALESEIKNIKMDGTATPLIVIATAGTTVFGSFDPLEDIALICEEYGIWFHVDACYGGSLIFSNKYRHNLKGIFRADSIAWNPHKMLGAPLQCSLLLVQHKNLLMEANSVSATYLFQQDKFYNMSFDTGDKSIQCGRKVDAFKLWLMWKARGKKSFEKFIDKAIENIEYFRSQISNHPGFQLVNNDECNINVCFWYIPKGMRNLARDEDWWNKINNVAPQIKKMMIISGSLMIGYNPLISKGLKNFFRLVIACHPIRDFTHLDDVIKKIEQFGDNVQIDN